LFFGFLVATARRTGCDCCFGAGQVRQYPWPQRAHRVLRLGSHLAVSGEPTADKQWRVRLYLDGKLVHEGVTKKLAAPMMIPPSLILGAELFYLHSSYYRGLIGRTTVFEQALSGEQIADLAMRARK
jgi:hypothetical protein